MEKIWVFDDDVDKEAIDNISQILKCPIKFAEVLYKKGLKDPDSAFKFMNPSLDDLNDPFLFKQMEKAIDRIISALRNKEKILIYGDYDVDGITSTALLYRILSYKLKGNIVYYIPNRLEEGYGLGDEGIKYALENDIKLVISVDCGITAIEQAAKFKENNIDLIISDHHTPKEELPVAYAIINPKVGGETYPFYELAGVGVAFKIMHALFLKLNLDLNELFSMLDLVALGTIADIVPLIGENRIIAKFGLEKMENSNIPGIRTLVKITGLENKKLSSSNIVFVLAPRINAVGRLGNALTALNLLISNDEKETKELALILDSKNTERKSIDKDIYEEACEIIEKNGLQNKYSIVLASPNWHSGVTGIVASKLVEKYYRPTVLIAIENGMGHGSARGIENLDLFNALQNCSEIMNKFGGHKFAAGLEIDEDKIELFSEKLEKVISNILTKDDLTPKLNITSVLTINECNFEFVNWLEKLAPFGPENMRPVFVLKQKKIYGYPSEKNGHIKFSIRDNGKILDFIGFNMANDYSEKLAITNEPIDIAFVLEFNKFNNLLKVQGKIKGIKVYD